MDLADPYVTEYGNMTAASLSPEMHERTVGYWYTVTAGAVAHTAFRTRGELEWWLAERGLDLAEPLADPGTVSVSAIIGRYRRASHRNAEAFDAIVPVFTTQVQDHAEWVPAKVTESDESPTVRTIHYMSVNYRPRRIR